MEYPESWYLAPDYTRGLLTDRQSSAPYPYPSQVKKGDRKGYNYPPLERQGGTNDIDEATMRAFGNNLN